MRRIAAIAGVGVIMLIGAIGSNKHENVELTSHNATTTTSVSTTTTTTVVVTTSTTVAPTTTARPSTATSTTALRTTTTTAAPSYYTNVDGDSIESPDSNTSGATGVCNDGTLTHATHHQGACSHHGGVDHWL